jgi:endonuclease/exonuclease/phosphatase (EEP) superfamily protein YafD
VKDETKLLHGKYIDSMIFERGDDHAYFAQKVRLDNGLTVVNYHGYWLPNPIGDDETVRCMQQVADWIKEETGPVVMCGDLNVSAESPAMRTLDFMTDLTATNKIRTTLQNIKFIKDVACDHILINDQVRANNLVVHDDLVSDHKTMSLDFDIISHDV